MSLTRCVPARLAVALVLGVSAGVAACGGSDTAPPQAPPGADVVVTGNDAFQFDPSEVEVSRGEDVALVCEGSLPHNLVVATETEDVEVVACGGREAAEAEVDLPPGEYEFFCNIPGHREAGMVGSIVVE